jgi:Flp pilus assembly protein TadD
VNTIGISGSDANSSLFSANQSQQNQLDYLSQNALSRGVNFYQQGNYDAAAKAFQRSIAISPSSSYTQDSYNYMVQSLMKLNRTDDAIKACKQAIQLDPTNDSYHSYLGNIYLNVNRYDDAAAEYNQAVRLNPSSEVNWYSLGQADIQTGNYTGAEQAFKKISGQNPLDAAFGLGQTYHRMGRYDDAVSALQSAIAINPKLGYAYLELGCVYTDQKEFDKAKEQASTLSSIDQSLTSQLTSYINQNENPQILVAYSTDFDLTGGPGTKVSDLDPSLAAPDSSKIFTMQFIFSKPMDVSTILSPASWSITKAYGQVPGGDYNWGFPLTPSDMTISPNPINVVYNPDSQTADVKFRVTQNASGDGTLDPSHLVFTFHGKDVYGKAMDPAADQYSNMSKIV